MTSKNFHKTIRWFIVIVLLLGILPIPNFNVSINYGIAIALIYLIFRTPLKYSK